MLRDLNLQVRISRKYNRKLANAGEGLVTVLNKDGEKIDKITIPYAPEITGLGFSRYLHSYQC